MRQNVPVTQREYPLVDSDTPLSTLGGIELTFAIRAGSDKAALAEGAA